MANESEAKTSSIASSARKWMAVAFAFAATLAVAALLINWQIQTRQNELRLQFAMNAARLGRAIELKYQSNREVVDNITNVMRLAESEARGSLLEIEGANPQSQRSCRLS